MIGKTNVLYGANGPGNPESDMRLLVTFPKGSVCTCTNGTMTMRALNTLGACVFYIPSTGDWTVSATDGTENLSATVSMTAGLKKSIKLVQSLTRQYLSNTLKNYKSTTATKIGKYAFYGHNIETVETSATNIGDYAFQNCYFLTTVDFTNTEPIQMRTYTFSGTRSLSAIILRSQTLTPLPDGSVLSIAKMCDGECGIYVPASLVDTYKSATNWSLYEKNIYPIDAYPVTNFETINDSWSEIFAAENDGTYSTKYSVGDRKYLSYDGENILAEIVALDTDTLASGGTAKITWMLKKCPEQKAMNGTSTTSGGWAESEARSYIRETCFYKLPEIIRNNIKTVSKTYYDYSTSSTKTINDTLWIPSLREIYPNLSVTMEDSGVIYPFFCDNTRRIKRVQANVNSDWFTRTAYTANNFWGINNGGYNISKKASVTSCGLLFGFCT